MNWAFTVNSDGSASSTGNNGLGPQPIPSDVDAILNITNTDSTLYSGYNNATGLVKYFARVKLGTYIGIGYGTSMDNVDMVSWMAGSTPATSQALDLWSRKSDLPSVFASNTYNTTSIVAGVGYVDFTTYRMPNPAAKQSIMGGDHNIPANDSYSIKLDS